MLRQSGEAARIFKRLRCRCDNAGIARKFALYGQLAVYPEQSRVQRKQHQADLLHQVEPVIPAAKVLQFMEHYLTHVLRRELCEAATRERGDEGTRNQ